MEENINTVAHRWLKEELKKDWICVDATMGRGNDTLFLAQNCAKVIAFDIQKEALEATRKRCFNQNNVELHLLSHEFLQQAIHEKIDCAVFNLGYLPRFDQTIITQPDSTAKALNAAWQLLKEGGVLLVVSYIGHPGGMQEHEVVKDFAASHASLIKTYRYTTKEDSPIAYYMRKEL